MRWLARRGHGESTLAATALGNLIAFAAVLPMALPVHGAGAADAAVVAYLGVFQVGLAYVCLTRGIRFVPGVEATTLLMVEPVMNPVWAWLVLGERPGGWAIGGGAVIVAATLVSTWWHARR
jgi:drug/metabolite transporter (DMT)-like permease